MARPVLIAGGWRNADASSTFQAENPATREKLPDEYPLSRWSDCDAALEAAASAFEVLREMPGHRIAEFLEVYAQRLEHRAEELVAMAHQETALPSSPRLKDVELPRTTNQLRLAANAARTGSWRHAVIDTAAGIRSCYAALGPVAVFGPNNFPFAFNSVAGGDFAAAIAAGNPVIGKANTSHPGTTRILAEEALIAIEETKMPPGTVQLLYRTSHEDGERLVSDHRLGATGYTGSRSAGLKLKAAADAAGKPIYLELSSINPVVVLPGAIEERGDQIADEFTSSCLMGTGQFCTNPGLVLLLAGETTDGFVRKLVNRFDAAPTGTLLSAGAAKGLAQVVGHLKKSGATPLTAGSGEGRGYSHPNTLLQIDGGTFLTDPVLWQTEAFGNVSLLVIADDVAQAGKIIDHLEGNLTGCLYTDTGGKDEPAYQQLAVRLRQTVGRLLNDKMPTGVAVSPAMNHGGPYPATGHPGFTAVGIPASMLRFAALHCYDNVRPHRLPLILQDANPTGETWRYIDGRWTQDAVS